MIDLYSWATPNGHKIHIFLEEIAIPYRAIPVDIGKGAQFAPEFLKISPNNKIPAIVDPDGPGGKPISIFESGAILIYLAEKSGKFLPTEAKKRYECLQWLMFQVGGFGPMLGQAHHFRIYAPQKIDYAIDRYTNEAHRLYRVLDKQLAENEFIAGGELTIADFAIYPWARAHANQGVDINLLPNFARWYAMMDARPSCVRGCQVLADLRPTGPITDEQREVMFGQKQFGKR